MRKKFIALTGILVLAAIVVGAGWMAFLAADVKADVKAEEEPPAEQPVVEEPPAPPPDTVATLCVSGDLVIHMPIVNEAYDSETGKYDFTYLFDQVKHCYDAADYSVACLETTFNGPPYSGYPQFCAPDELAASLRNVGFDLLSTVGNHSLDTYYDGVVRTLDVLDEAGLEHVGTYRTQEEADKVKVIDVGGIRLALLGYTYGTNGLPLGDHPYAVNVFAEDYMTNCADVNYERIAADLEKAKATDADAIAVYMHWGQEYHTTPSQQQMELADFLFEHGATLVLGGHVHVPQPMEMRALPDGRIGYLCYCLGNLISNQLDPYTNLTAAVTLELTKDGETGEVTVSGVSYLPMYMLHADASNEGCYRLLDIKETMRQYESGDKSVISSYTYGQIAQGLEDMRRIFRMDENGQPVNIELEENE